MVNVKRTSVRSSGLFVGSAVVLACIKTRDASGQCMTVSRTASWTVSLKLTRLALTEELVEEENESVRLAGSGVEARRAPIDAAKSKKAQGLHSSHMA